MRVSSNAGLDGLLQRQLAVETAPCKRVAPSNKPPENALMEKLATTRASNPSGPDDGDGKQDHPEYGDAKHRALLVLHELEAPDDDCSNAHRGKVTKKRSPHLRTSPSNLR